MNLNKNDSYSNTTPLRIARLVGATAGPSGSLGAGHRRSRCDNPSMLKFELLATDGRARRGRLTFNHGVIETPV